MNLSRALSLTPVPHLQLLFQVAGTYQTQVISRGTRYGAYTASLPPHRLIFKQVCSRGA